ncbi:cbb3-type cytochrome oxidase assembly protein CcoS [Microbulbifer epialgicus]|uniref:Cbb3-type cytochrome oxidase assembly protein CcoS n=1 Tax=Microbulbifer epialgicus TaxID=393907 RepID=A0ABV4NY71_9GAMM
MESLYFLIPIAMVFVVLAIKLFFWAVNTGQYDDLETEGRRILFEDDAQKQPIADVDREK